MSKTNGLAASPKKAKSLSGKNPTPSTGVVMDGILHPSQSVNIIQPQPKKQVSDRPTAQKIHWQASRSMALMRQAVAAPKRLPLIKADIKHVHKVAGIKRRQAGLAAKVDGGKSARANSVSRSDRVSRFGSFGSHIRQHQPVAKISAQVRVMSPAAAGRPMLAASATTMALAHPVPALPANISNQKLEAMLDRALAQADAHKQALGGRFKRGIWRSLRTPRALVMATILVLALALAIFYAYLRIPAFSVRVASLVSGVDAHAPSYIPPGYSLTKTDFANGDVTMTFAKGASTFSISQQKSGLNDTALQTSVAAPASKLYQASQYNGVTVYTYSSKDGANSLNATLVNQGVKTTVSNNANLNNDQLTKIVQGLL